MRVLLDTLSELADTGIDWFNWGARGLRFLYLSRSRITDEGLAAIGNLHRLEGLNLVDTSIGDPSIEELKKLNSLEWLNLSATNISDAAARELRTALPNCDVIH
jgi:Leucine-rich repeat (LRR) protein